MPWVMGREGSGGRNTAPEGPRGPAESSMGRRGQPLPRDRNWCQLHFQEAPKKCFKKLARTGQWGAGDLPPPFHTILPQSDIHRLVTSDGTYPVTPTPRGSMGTPALPVPPARSYAAPMCLLTCVRVRVCLLPCCETVPVTSPDSGRQGHSYATFSHDSVAAF